MASFYLNIVPEGSGTWEVVHNIWPTQKHGGGQVIVKGKSKEEAVAIAEKLVDVDTVIRVDPDNGLTSQQLYDAWLKANK